MLFVGFVADGGVSKQYVIAVLIVGAFLSSIVSAELLTPSLSPEEYKKTSRRVEHVEMGFTVLFTLELLINFFANFFFRFFGSAWNIFDLLIVIMCW